MVKYCIKKQYEQTINMYICRYTHINKQPDNPNCIEKV